MVQTESVPYSVKSLSSIRQSYLHIPNTVTLHRNNIIFNGHGQSFSNDWIGLEAGNLEE